MKNLLIALGDSYTEGVGCYEPISLDLYKKGQITISELYHKSNSRFKYFAWPAHVARNLNYDLINLGQGGYSNSAIAKSFIKDQFKNLKSKYDNVIVMSLFSCPLRISFYKDGQIYSLFVGSTGDAEIKLYESYVDFINISLKNIKKSPTDCILETVFYMRSIESFCEANGYHFLYGNSITDINELIPYYNTRYNLHNYLDSNITRMNDFVRKSLDKSAVCGHPNEKGYTYIGEQLTEVLINNFSNII